MLNKTSSLPKPEHMGHEGEGWEFGVRARKEKGFPLWYREKGKCPFNSCPSGCGQLSPD